MQERNLTIYFTSDLHSYIYPTDYRSQEEKDLGLFKCASQFQKDGNTLIIDGGDLLQGSPLGAFCHDTVGSAAQFAQIMNRCGYDYVTLGNHDFNYGMPYLDSYLNALRARCVCENVRWDEGDVRFPARVHMLENGLRVGIVGIVTDYVNIWERPEHLSGIRIEDPIPAAAAALAALKGKVDLTVCVYHGGFERDLASGRTLSATHENVAYRICQELDFDILLTGHQHMRVDGVRFCNSFAVQPTYRAPHCCGITVTVEDDGSKRFESRIISAEGKPLARAYDLLLPLEKRVQTWLDTPAGHLDLPLVSEDHLKAALNGSDLANFINTVQLEASGAQIASSALPNEFKGLPTEVTIRDVVSTYIYTNTLVVLEMTRPALKQYIERSAAYFDHDEDGNLCIADEFLRPKVQHYNYDFFSGIHYTIDARNPVGQRVTSIVLDGRELGEDEPVTVCVNSYRFCGTGGYDMLPKQKVAREVLTDVADAMIDYITSHPNIRVDTEKYCTVIG